MRWRQPAGPFEVVGVSLVGASLTTGLTFSAAVETVGGGTEPGLVDVGVGSPLDLPAGVTGTSVPGVTYPIGAAPGDTVTMTVADITTLQPDDGGNPLLDSSVTLTA